ncbi:MAG: ROK family protein [Bacteroidetes bacterium]|nr:ROK family protein [Bacteroidota bacterium]
MVEVALGIDIGGTNTVYSAVDRNGNCLVNGRISTNDYIDFSMFLQNLVKSINNSISSFDQDKLELIGIGIGAPNGNFFTGTIEYAPNLKWTGIIDVVSSFKKYFENIPVVLTNDANAAAIGEKVFGSAKGMKDFIVITLGTGLGSGIVVDGKVLYGKDGFAGEVGHTIVYYDGRECGCGRKGCLETYASASGIKRTVIEMLETSNLPSVFRGLNENEVSSKKIFEAATKGDQISIDAFEFTGKILGWKLADVVAILNPEAIFLYGGLAQAGDLIFNPTKKHMEDQLLKIFKNKVKLLPSGLSCEQAAVLGASALIWKERGI